MADAQRLNLAAEVPSHALTLIGAGNLLKKRPKKGPMNSDSTKGRSLREIELEILEEGCEWTRRRLEQKLQEQANRQGGVFPPQQPKGASSAKAVDGAANRRRPIVY